MLSCRGYGTFAALATPVVGFNRHVPAQINVVLGLGFDGQQGAKKCPPYGSETWLPRFPNRPAGDVIVPAPGAGNT
jgi:hypothetical protein